MTTKKVIRVLLLIFVVASASFLIAKEYGLNRFQEDMETVSPANPKAATDAVVVYYFYGYRRCPTCNAIERYVFETLNTDFAAQLEDGTLAWRPLNVEEPQNRHFIRDLGLVSSTAVIADMNGDVVVRSKKLDLVWKLVRDKPAFMEYVRNGTISFIAEGGKR